LGYLIAEFYELLRCNMWFINVYHTAWSHGKIICLSWLYPRHPIRLSRAAVFVQSLVCAVYSSGLVIRCAVRTLWDW